jgi:2'-5' RNA ligase
MRAEYLHITLAFLGDTPEDKLAAIATAAASVDAPAFDLRIDTPNYWKHNSIAWAGVSSMPPALTDLEEKLRLGLVAHAVDFDSREFVPHVTLLRDARNPPAMPRLDPIDWPVRDFALVRSAGGGYEVAASWPLARVKFSP